MNYFQYRDGELHCEEVKVNQLAEKVGTPFYLYSEKTVREHFRRFKKAFQELNPQICYSIKNCGNINMIRLLVEEGAGIDVVSGGEIYRALAAGADPDRIVYAGVGKTDTEIRQALEAKIGWLNIESEEEFENLSRICQEMNCKVKVALRINPNVYDKKTHQKCATGKVDSKFGVDIKRVIPFFDHYGNDPYVSLKGIHFHLGSPIFSAEPYVQAIDKTLDVVKQLAARQHEIEMLDLGGGYLAHYDSTDDVQTWAEYAAEIVPLLKPFVNAGGLVVLEPGRSLVANAGVLIAAVQYNKVGLNKKFIIVDTGMGQMPRPAMYDAYHFIWPTKVPPELVPANRNPDAGLKGAAGLGVYDVVGPICESSDTLARERQLPPVKKGDYVCLFTAGSYCMSMASQYNATPRPPEVLVSGNTARMIRERETYSDLIELEKTIRPIDLS